MSGDNGRAALTDARAILAAMVSEGLARVHVSSAGTEIFISRSGGDNPMSLRKTPSAPTESRASAVERAITAPHVATVEAIAGVGDWIEAGSEVARLRVLDRYSSVVSDVAGVIGATAVARGALVEYGQRLAILEVGV